VENRNLKHFYIISAAVFGIDQFSKFLATSFLSGRPASFDIFGYLSLTLVRNTGICFGMLSRWNIKYPVIAASLLIAVFIFIYLYRQKIKTVRIQAALGMIEGGIIGNMADRLRVNGVIDFINLHFWPVFNLADVFIVSGICIILLEHFRGKNVPGISEVR
jgi:signal peptidase II